MPLHSNCQKAQHSQGHSVSQLLCAGNRITESKCEMFLMTYVLQSMDIWDFFLALKLPGYFLFEIKLLDHCWLVSWLVFISIKIIKYV